MTSGINSQEPIYMWRLEGDGWMECTKECFEGDISSGYEKRIVYASPVQQSPAVAIPKTETTSTAVVVPDFESWWNSQASYRAEHKYPSKVAFEACIGLMLSTPTPPSAEQKAILAERFNGRKLPDEPISEIMEPNDIVDQPDSAAPNEHVAEITFAHKGKSDGSFFDVHWTQHTKLKTGDKLYLHPPTKPQRITEQDAREILASYSAYVGADAEIFIDAWLNTHEGKSLIAKASAPADSEVK